jgi:hypothetical protein
VSAHLLNGVRVSIRVSGDDIANERMAYPSILLSEFGEPARSRTENLQIKSLLLCQLSYGPTREGITNRL